MTRLGQILEEESFCLSESRDTRDEKDPNGAANDGSACQAGPGHSFAEAAVFEEVLFHAADMFIEQVG